MYVCIYTCIISRDVQVIKCIYQFGKVEYYKWALVELENFKFSDLKVSN